MEQKAKQKNLKNVQSDQKRRALKVVDKEGVVVKEIKPLSRSQTL
jgi:hypothetical protein